MNRRITIIIATDFCCWIPFIIICALHSLEILDATPWYSLFSMVILPVNSVINPFLYDDTVLGLLSTPLQYITRRITSTSIYQSIITRFSTEQPEVIEMEQIEVRQVVDGPGAGGDLVGTNDMEEDDPNRIDECS